MTEQNIKNREIYLDLCKNVWDLDDESMAYIEHRTSDEWKPVPELESLIGTEGTTYEDQRIRFDLDMSNKTVQSLFETNDESYSLFKSFFRRALEDLWENYSIQISYSDFVSNKIVFKKNTMKIKKVLETIYAENPDRYEREFGETYSKEDCAKSIVSAYEKIGASKKSAKKLQFVISFNPMDWLMASTSQTWSSCFNINNQSGGFGYCLGLPFLCGDKNRMMLYITDGNQKECMGIKVDSVHTRTWCILDKSNKMCIVKWYPNDTVGVDPVKLITKNSAFSSRVDFSEGKYPLDIISTKNGAVINVYSDMGHWKFEDGKLVHQGNGKDGQQFFTKEGTDCLNGSSNSSYSIKSIEEGKLGLWRGYIIPYWKEIGMHLDQMFPAFKCSSCGQVSGGFALGRGTGKKFVCHTCYADSMCTCTRCNTSMLKKDAKKIETTDGKTVSVCSSCIEEISKCDECGKYSFEDLTNTKEGKKICKACAKKLNYIKCDSCGKLSKGIVYKYSELQKETMCYCSDCNKPLDGYSSTFGRLFRVYETTNVGGDVE